MNSLTPLSYAAIIILFLLIMGIAQYIWILNRTSQIRSPYTTLIQIIGLVFITEMLVMLIIGMIKQDIMTQEGILDSTLLSILLSPLLYLLVIRPLHMEIEDQARKVESIVNSASNAIMVINEKGTIEVFNPKAESLFGYTASEILGKNVNILMPEPYHSEHDGYIKKYLETGIAHILSKGPREVPGLRKDGSVFPLQVSLNEMKIGDRRLFLGMIEDITERKKAESELKKSNEKFQNFFYLNPEPAAITKLDGTLVIVNQECCDVLEYTPDEMIGHKTTELGLYIQPDTDRTFMVEQLTKNNYVKNIEFQVRNKSGEILDILYSAQLIDIDGEPHILSIFRDITKENLAEKEILRARDAAEIANKSKSEFLANMSHEIRTPLNAILGITDLLGESELNDEQQKYIGIVQKSGDHLLNLINDILDISKIEAGHIEIDYTDFHLPGIIEKIQDMMAVRARSKTLELTCHLAPDMPVHLIGDPYRLSQILYNLISNAIKFTNEGTIILDISRKSDNEDDKTIELLFRVEDTGIGIPADKMDRLFQKFTQVDSSTTRKYGGTGLGLAISKRLIEMMGGKIWAESEFNQGSTFYFTVKFHFSSVTTLYNAENIIDLHGMRTLIIDDNEINRIILREFLTSWMAIVHDVDGGNAGLKELQRAKNDGEPYQLLLLDYHMPDMDGFEVARKIKEETNCFDTTVIMLSSDDQVGQTEKFKQVGIENYLIKPIKKNMLLEIINKTLQKNENKPSVDNVKKRERNYLEAAPVTGIRKKVLLVDDAEDNRNLILFYLKKSNYDVDTAENGEIAVDKFKNNNYDMVLMDIQMPVMDGYVATRIIRYWEKENNRIRTPIIALTAHAFREDMEKTKEAGCDEHLIKPIKKHILLDSLDKYFNS